MLGLIRLRCIECALAPVDGLARNCSLLLQPNRGGPCRLPTVTSTFYPSLGRSLARAAADNRHRTVRRAQAITYLLTCFVACKPPMSITSARLLSIGSRVQGLRQFYNRFSYSIATAVCCLAPRNFASHQKQHQKTPQAYAGVATPNSAGKTAPSQSLFNLSRCEQSPCGRPCGACSDPGA